MASSSCDKNRCLSRNHFPARYKSVSATFTDILLVGDPEVLLELVQPDVGVPVAVEAITAAVKADGKGRSQLVGQVCLPGLGGNMVGTSFWYLFGTYLILFGTFWIPGRVNRVGRGKLEISIHLHWVLCAKIWMAFFVEIGSLVVKSIPLQLVPSIPRVPGLPSHRNTPSQQTEGRPEIKMWL